MSLKEAILESLRDLPAEKCAGLGVSISEEDIVEARREMWQNFPRDDI